MATLQEKRVNFNSKLVVNHTGGNLSTDSGLILVKEFMDSIGFSKLAAHFLTFQDNRSYWIHDNISLLEQLLFQLIGGYPADSSANSLKEDPVFQLVLEKEAIASQASLSRFWDRMSETTISQFQTLNQAMIDKVRLERNATELIIDLDSTHSDTFGNQEATNFNAHYKTNGYHPLVAFDGLTGDFLKAELRSGNVYTSKGIKDFLEPMLAHYSQTLPCTDIMVRGDSGFATPEVYDTCEAHQSYYVVRLKNNTKLAEIAESFILIGNDHPWEEREVHYYSTTYQAKSWKKARRICIKSTREANELLFRHEYLITNCSEDLSAQTMFRLYHNRGTMENFIKEAKNGFYFDKTDSSSFLENHARMMVSLLAYNLTNFMKSICLPANEAVFQVDTLRLRLFKVAGKLIKSGRRLFLKLSSSHVYQQSFYHLLQKIQQLAW
ncbi:IS1380 family transposase [Enterococcus lactis]|uniref:IS1380 family transposase n=1 Tax=Enterococcus lactis TaxID=357441 RepID=UPI002947072D|nr:IS1380 family transposase [Enterococcus lactis]MDV5138415.1 IS1380 family transposase [Enterococcus lactis]